MRDEPLLRNSNRCISSHLPPSRLTNSTVGLRPTTPHMALGHEMLPWVSVPSVEGARPTAAATAEPDDDPPGSPDGKYGLVVWPPRADHPGGKDGWRERKWAHSDYWRPDNVRGEIEKGRINTEDGPCSSFQGLLHRIRGVWRRRGRLEKERHRVGRAIRPRCLDFRSLRKKEEQ